MTKKKSIWAFVLAVCLIVPAMFMMTACGNKKLAVEKFTAEVYVIPKDASLGIGRNSPIFNDLEVEIFVGDEDNGIVGTITALTGENDPTMIKSGETGIVTITLNSKTTLLSKGLEFVIKEKDTNGNKNTTIRGTILSIVEAE